MINQTESKPEVKTETNNTMSTLTTKGKRGFSALDIIKIEGWLNEKEIATMIKALYKLAK